MVSLDVVSLFTNIPINLALQVLDRRWEEIKIHTNIDRNDFLHAVSFVLESNVFLFNETYYKQVFGTAMGSPISPVIANIVMEELETVSLSKVHFNLIFYKRYVDDIITCLRLEDLQILLDTFNSFHARLQFTHEMRRTHVLVFLIQLSLDQIIELSRIGITNLVGREDILIFAPHILCNTRWV